MTLLGDRLKEALSKVGVTEERVSKWLGRPCGCKQRREKLNKLSLWASSYFKGETTDKHLDEILTKE
jgi:hypothetical protein